MALRDIKMSKVFTDIRLRWPSLINNDNESLTNKESFTKMGRVGGPSGAKESKSLVRGDVALQITQVNYTMCYLWNTSRLASQLIKWLANRPVVHICLCMWSWHEPNLLFSIFNVLPVCQGSVQITDPFWSFPWLSKSTKHSIRTRERPNIF